MPDRIASDADGVTTHRARLARSGGTRLPCLRLPDGLGVEAGDEIRLVLDGTRYHARVAGDASGLLVRGAYDNRRLVRENTGEGENRLVEWCREHDREPDDAVDLDAVDPGHLYGLRVPGERTVYEVSKRPNSSLQDIADSLYDDSG
ncbi:DUF7112 family protein [Candidatus Halobonum tyrrellensis]|uniref:Uncharacterized protein n=1 Tax=Candidatus Halobonum tyrrellensis G22 TaxID=1324957 RepID=V4HHZ2_9EURY|nr:hypothetical protein [Candidatus Halobonum tyrrellensis]ESP87529.1 hypothetical protein K933_13691 [Candidatus Halobonum tyrrellensis G22]